MTKVIIKKKKLKKTFGDKEYQPKKINFVNKNILNILNKTWEIVSKYSF